MPTSSRRLSASMMARIAPTTSLLPDVLHPSVEPVDREHDAHAHEHARYQHPHGLPHIASMMSTIVPTTSNSHITVRSPFTANALRR